MRLYLAALFSVLPALALAYEYPSFVPVEKRQKPGTPEYACHEDCGKSIYLPCDGSILTTFKAP